MKKTEIRWGVKVAIKTMNLICPNCHKPFVGPESFHFDPTDRTRLICHRTVTRKGAVDFCHGVIQSPVFAIMYDKAHRSGMLTKVNELKKVLCLHEPT